MTDLCNITKKYFLCSWFNNKCTAMAVTMFGTHTKMLDCYMNYRGVSELWVIHGGILNSIINRGLEGESIIYVCIIWSTTMPIHLQLFHSVMRKESVNVKKIKQKKKQTKKKLNMNSDTEREVTKWMCNKTNKKNDSCSQVTESILFSGLYSATSKLTM